jgi:hypothetical protein
MALASGGETPSIRLASSFVSTCRREISRWRHGRLAAGNTGNECELALLPRGRAPPVHEEAQGPITAGGRCDRPTAFIKASHNR